MYSISLTASYFLTLWTFATGMLYEGSFTELRPRTAFHLQDHGLNDNLFSREAIPFGLMDQESWDHSSALSRRYAQPWFQSDTGFEYGDTRLYARAPGKGPKGKGGKAGKGKAASPGIQNKAPGSAGDGAGNNKKPPPSPKLGETSSSSTSSKLAAQGSSSDTSGGRNQLLDIVKQHYNWPPTGYKQMNKNERIAAGAKVIQEHRRKLTSDLTFASSGTSVRDMVNKFENPSSGESTSSTTPTKKAVPNSEAQPKKEASSALPVSKFAQAPEHGGGSSASSWASLSRQSSLSRSATPVPNSLSRQESSKSTASGVHIQRPPSANRQSSGPGDDWTIV